MQRLSFTSMLLLLPFASTALAACACTRQQIYVNPKADPAAGKAANGSSPDVAFANVFDAQQRVKYLLANSDDNTQVVVNLASGVYPMQTYLRLTDRESGSKQCPTLWRARDGEAVLSGGKKITGWSPAPGLDGVFMAKAPANSRTRALFVDGVSMRRAHSVLLNQKNATYTPQGFQYNGTEIEFSKIEKVQQAEVRGILTFTDRYTPVDHLSPDGKTLVMKQPAWYRQLIGYDIMTNKHMIELTIENSISFLDEDGEWYLDTDDDTLYYKPMGGKDPNSSDIILPHLELVLSVGGFTYDMPAHDMRFENITFAHTTWNYPSSQYGFPDQQTGAFIGEPWNRSTFEEFRPRWWMTPGTVQVSAAERITFRGGAVTCTGAAGLAVGNDDNAHVSNVGYGAKQINISRMRFTQVGGNALQVGGVGLNAHHPIIPAMVNSKIVANNNYFNNNSFIYTSAANIFYTYVQDSAITSNTILNTWYSGICMGYGWGHNDAGGNDLYQGLGLYEHQPVYQTPTTAHDNLINKNYLENIGLLERHWDLGGIYTLSAQNGTVMEGNVIHKCTKWGLYYDQGSRWYTARDNVVDSRDHWLFMNYVNGAKTGNQTIVDNFGNGNESLSIGYDSHGNYIDRNTFFNSTTTAYPDGLPERARQIVAAAGWDKS